MTSVKFARFAVTVNEQDRNALMEFVLKRGGNITECFEPREETRETPGKALILLPGKRKSNENAASASSKKRVVFKEYQLSGLRQAFQGTNGHASPELTEKLAETLDVDAKQVKTWFQNQRNKAKREY
ncbi:unnamed protein product [Porites lobata]|uniref:Homeobox domain-containing protein n=1 Tax=Porites lobata TaxID=104759 RepID=A0ABN8RXI7_9CNID|nr:unnamed protein product [Porites lobata]